MSHALWPWEVHHFRHKDGGWVAIFHRPGKRTAEIFRIHFPPGFGQRALEISRLIELIPEFLDVLKFVEADLGNTVMPVRLVSHFGVLYGKVRTAVDRAEGKDGAK